MSISNVCNSTQIVYGYQSSATNKSAAPRNAGANEQVQGERQKTANPVAQDTAAGRSNIVQGARSPAAGRSNIDIVQAAIDDIYKAAKDGAFGPLGETLVLGIENIIQGATSLSPNAQGAKPPTPVGSDIDLYQAVKDGVFGPLGETLVLGIEQIIQGAMTVKPNGSNITYGPKPNITYGPNNGALGYHGDDLDRVLTHLQNNFGMSADQAKKWLGAAGSLSTTNTNGYSGVGNSRNNGAPLPSGVGNSRNNGAPLPEDMRSSQSNLNASGSKKNSFVDVLV